MSGNVSRTEQALRTLRAALSKAYAAQGWQDLRRNDVLDSVLDDLGNGAQQIFNLIDGNGGPEGAPGEGGDEVLGADEMADGYDIVHLAELEFLASNPDPDALDVNFDRGLIVTDTAIAADRTLGGVVNDCRLVPPLERSNPRTDGLPGVKYAVMRVQLTFTSNRIF